MRVLIARIKQGAYKHLNVNGVTIKFIQWAEICDEDVESVVMCCCFNI